MLLGVQETQALSLVLPGTLSDFWCLLVDLKG